MSFSSALDTNPSLLVRVGQRDHRAWEEFARRYEPMIAQRCRQWGLQDADVREVTQDVLLRLVKAMQEFHYDPKKGRFRAWLDTVTSRVLCDWHKEWKRAQRQGMMGTGDSAVLERLASVEAREELIRDFEKQHKVELYNEACSRVQKRVEPRTWEAFRLRVMEGRSQEEVASQLQMSVAAMYAAKKRILQMLKEETRALDRQGGF